MHQRPNVRDVRWRSAMQGKYPPVLVGSSDPQNNQVHDQNIEPRSWSMRLFDGKSKVGFVTASSPSPGRAATSFVATLRDANADDQQGGATTGSTMTRHGAERGRDWTGRDKLGFTGFGGWTGQEAEMDVLIPEGAVHAEKAWDMMVHQTTAAARSEATRLGKRLARGSCG